jgi:hypothetical protein
MGSNATRRELRGRSIPPSAEKGPRGSGTRARADVPPAPRVPRFDPPTLGACESDTLREIPLEPAHSVPPSSEDPWFATSPRFTAPPPLPTAPPPRPIHVEHSRRKRQKLVISAVCALGCMVFGLAAWRGIHRRIEWPSPPPEVHAATQVASGPDSAPVAPPTPPAATTTAPTTTAPTAAPHLTKKAGNTAAAARPVVMGTPSRIRTVAPSDRSRSGFSPSSI